MAMGGSFSLVASVQLHSLQAVYKYAAVRPLSTSCLTIPDIFFDNSTAHRYQLPVQQIEGIPIRVVARRVGLTPHVIRAWERRYRVVSPQRSATNRRTYTEADIRRLSLLRQAAATGHNISQIAHLPDEELMKLIAADRSGPAVAASSWMPTTSTKPAEIVSECWAAIAKLEDQRLDNLLAHAAVVLPLPVLLTEVVAALMEQVGEHWQRGTLRVAQEHLATTVVRDFLGNLHNTRRAGATGPCVVVSTPAGALHEIGALLAVVTAADVGWQTRYLGPSLPAEEIASAADGSHACAVALSIIHPPNHPALIRELHCLRRCLAPTVNVLVGGRAAVSYAPVLREIGAVLIRDLAHWRDELSQQRLWTHNGALP